MKSHVILGPECIKLHEALRETSSNFNAWSETMAKNHKDFVVHEVHPHQEKLGIRWQISLLVLYSCTP